MDLDCYFKARNDYVAYERNRVLQQVIQTFHDNNPLGATIMLIAHSRGCAYSRNTMIASPKYLRERVEFVGIAPVLICRGIFVRVYNILQVQEISFLL